MDKYKIYESEKRKLQNQGLEPMEYEEEVRKLADRLGI